MRYKLLVVTVAYKPIVQELYDFIDSFYKYNDLGDAVKLVVVDNSPTAFWDMSKARKKYPLVKFYENPGNPGFGAANNIGFSLFKSDYVLFMNNDTEFTEPVFCHCVSILETKPDIGCVGINQVNGMPFFPKFTTPRHFKIRGFDERYCHISGAFMFFKSAVFQECGMFDPRIFLYLEEYDISQRLNEKGYHVLYEPNCFFLHKKGKHRKEISEHLWRIGAQSQLYVCRKYGLNPRLGFSDVNKRLYKYLCYYLVLFRFNDFFKVIRILRYRYTLLR